jgi:hypothetical protein
MLGYSARVRAAPLTHGDRVMTIDEFILFARGVLAPAHLREVDVVGYRRSCMATIGTPPSLFQPHQDLPTCTPDASSIFGVFTIHNPRVSKGNSVRSRFVGRSSQRRRRFAEKWLTTVFSLVPLSNFMARGICNSDVIAFAKPRQP